MNLNGESMGVHAQRIAEELVHRLQSASPETIAALFSEDVDWDIPGATDVVPWLGKRHSRAEVEAFYREMPSYVEPTSFTVRGISATAERATIVGNFSGKVKPTRTSIDSEFVIDIEVSSGLIQRYRFFEDSFAVANAVSKA